MKRLLARLTHALSRSPRRSKADMVRYDRIPPGQITVIPNGVDADAISRGDRARGRLALGIPEDAQVIGAVGRIMEQKGHRYLIEALARIKVAHPKALVLLVGDGKLEGELKAIAERPRDRRQRDIRRCARRRPRHARGYGRIRYALALGGVRHSAYRGDGDGQAGGRDLDPSVS